jgi:hypothetical protein
LFRAVDDQGLGSALPPLNHTRVNKDSPDNRSNLWPVKTNHSESGAYDPAWAMRFLM